MPLEIERRFLVAHQDWRDHVAWEAELRQGYLFSGDDGLTARIRLQQQRHQAPQAWLTIKTRPNPGVPDHVRLEFEYPIPIEDAEELLHQAPCRVEKRRYGLLLPGGDWVLDVFGEANVPLVIAEVELPNPDTPLSIPPWCGDEITGLHKLSNASLAFHPWQAWTDSERAALAKELFERGSG